MVEPLIVVVVVALFTSPAAVGAVFLKRGSAKFSLNLLEQLKNFNLLFGLSLYALPAPVYLWALKNADLSLIYPITALNYVWISFLSVKFLNEHMNKYKWIGIGAIILGVVMLSLSVV